VKTEVEFVIFFKNASRHTQSVADRPFIKRGW